MEKQNDSHIQNTIMKQNNHLFIYGCNTETRKQFLKNMAERYPITLNGSNPIGIYLDSIGLPKTPQINNDLDEIALSTFSSTYCDLSIITNILDTTLKQIDKNDINRREKAILNRFNHLCLNKESINAKSLQELRDILDNVRNNYYEEYENYIKSGGINNPLSDMPISFIDINKFAIYYKQMINTNSHIGIIVDHQNPVTLKSIQAINRLVCSRINPHLSMKIACKPNEWETYADLNGTLATAPYDYKTINLSESKKYLKK